MARPRAGVRGMTLIEVMIVVAIIGVIAVLAAVGYGRYVRNAKMSEATTMVAAIREAQENYKLASGHYLNVSGGTTPGNFYPAATPGPFKTKWGVACTTCAAPWKSLDVKSDADVWFGYATMADEGAVDPDTKGVDVRIKGSKLDFKVYNGGAAITKPWYVVVATADTDGNGKFCVVVGSSLTTEIVVDNEGE